MSTLNVSDISQSDVTKQYRQRSGKSKKKKNCDFHYTIKTRIFIISKLKTLKICLFQRWNSGAPENQLTALNFNSFLRFISEQNF